MFIHLFISQVIFGSRDLHICSVIPPWTSRVWHKLHPCSFKWQRRSSDFFGGWGAGLFFVLLENPAWTVNRGTTVREETRTPRTSVKSRRHGGWVCPEREAWIEIKQYRSPAQPLVDPGSAGRQQLAAITVSLNSSVGPGGSGRGRGRGYTVKGEDNTPRGGGWKSETLPAWRGRRFGHSTLD